MVLKNFFRGVHRNIAERAESFEELRAQTR